MFLTLDKERSLIPFSGWMDHTDWIEMELEQRTIE